MKHIPLFIVVAVVGLVGARALAQVPAEEGARGAAHAPAEGEAHAPAGEAHGAAGHADAGPVPPPHDHRWPGVLVFLILVMFFMAAVIGPIVRAQAPPEMPPTHSHDEPPGASHHHGHTGTINPVPEDVRRLEDAHGHDHH